MQHVTSQTGLNQTNCTCGGEPVLNVRILFGRCRVYSISYLTCGRKTGDYLTMDGAETEWEEMNNG